jgi:hypothetical protein
VIAIPGLRHVQVPIVQLVVPTEIVTHVQVPVRHQIEENAVTVQGIHDHLQIVPIARHVRTVTDQNVVMIVVQLVIARHVRTVTDQNVVMIVVHQVIVQPVAHMVTAIHDDVIDRD